MLPVEYLQNGKRYPSSVFTFCNLHSFSTKCYNDDSVVVIVSEILVFKNEVVEIFGDFFNRAKTKNSVSCSSTEFNKEITLNFIGAMCVRSNISETVTAIRVLFPLFGTWIIFLRTTITTTL